MPQFVADGAVLFLGAVLCFLLRGGDAWIALQHHPITHLSSCQQTRACSLWGWSRQGQLDTTTTRSGTTLTTTDKDNKAHAFVEISGCQQNLSSPREWLESLPDGAYTVIRCDYCSNSTTWNVFGRDFHLRRLQESIQSFAAAARPLADNRQPIISVGSQNWTDAPEKATNQIIDALLSQAEKEAVDSDDENPQTSFGVNSFMVTILWWWCQQHHDQPQFSLLEGEITVQGHICGSTRWLADARSAIADPVTAVIARIPAMSTVRDKKAARPLQLPNRQEPNPRAKLSSWCRNRRPLELHFKKSPGIGEVLLVDDNHDTISTPTTTRTSSQAGVVKANPSIRILEGLTSNVFFLYSNNVLRTASQGVLLGYARQEIVKSAERLGITVDTSSPIDLFNDRHLWQEVFLSSAIKIVVPVKKILIPSDSFLGDGDGSGHQGLEQVWSHDDTESKRGHQRLYEKIYRDIITVHMTN